MVARIVLFRNIFYDQFYPCNFTNFISIFPAFQEMDKVIAFAWSALQALNKPTQVSVVHVTIISDFLSIHTYVDSTLHADT